MWYWPRSPLRDFGKPHARWPGLRRIRRAGRVDCTQRLDRGPHGQSRWATAPAREAPGGVIQAVPASVRPRRNTSKAPFDGATPKDDGRGDSRTWIPTTPARRPRLGTKWESRALARALHSSIALTCAPVHLRKAVTGRHHSVSLGLYEHGHAAYRRPVPGRRVRRVCSRPPGTWRRVAMPSMNACSAASNLPAARLASPRPQRCTMVPRT